MQIGRFLDVHYIDLLLRLLPVGVFWRACTRPGAPLHRILWGCAAELSRIHNRLHDAWLEIDPATATETLAEREASVGVTRLSTLAARRAAVTAQLRRVGSNNPANQIPILEAFGATDVQIVTRPDLVPRVNWARCGAPCVSKDALFTWRVSATLAADLRTTAETALAAAAPAHVAFIFDWS